MSVRLRAKVSEKSGRNVTEVVDFETFETTFDNQTFAWGPGQVRNFADDGVGIGFTNATENIVQDTIPFGDSRS